VVETRLAELGWTRHEANDRPPFERSGGVRGKVLYWTLGGRTVRVEIRTSPTNALTPATINSFWSDSGHPDNERKSRNLIGDFETVFKVDVRGADAYSRSVAGN
jgi:hypothetical protein